MKWFFLILLLTLTLGYVNAQGNHQVMIQVAIERQMISFPASTLKDLYKSFFQNRFGPGHMINDSARAAEYLNKELSIGNFSTVWEVEPTGADSCFYRVNLSVVADGRVTTEQFLDAFIRSANEHVPISLDAWVAEWQEVIMIIESMSLSLPDYEADKKEIESRLQSGNYVGHHSETYRKAYKPHYRIIKKALFENEMKDLVTK